MKSRRTSNSAPFPPGVESGSGEAPSNEDSAKAGTLAQRDQSEGGNTTSPVAAEVTFSGDGQSAASLPMESHAASETESTSQKPAVPTAEPRTGFPNVVEIKSTLTPTRQRASRTAAALVVAEENKANVAATNGQGWLVTQAHIDSPSSSKYGLSLTAGLQAYGRARLFRGDLVLVEIGRGDTVYRVTGRASRRAAAYFAKADLAQAGIKLHTPFQYVVLGVTSPSQLEGGQP